MEYVSGNIFIRPNVMNKGDKIVGHKHHFDHTSIVFTGAVHVKANLPDGTVIEKDFASASHFLVLADAVHEITALEENTVFWCVYSHRTPQGDVVQENTGWTKAYQSKDD